MTIPPHKHREDQQEVQTDPERDPMMRRHGPENDPGKDNHQTRSKGIDRGLSGYACELRPGDVLRRWLLVGPWRCERLGLHDQCDLSVVGVPGVLAIIPSMA